MNKTKKNFLSIVFAMVMLAVSLLTLNVGALKKADALTSSGNENHTIYYFSDSAPILDENVFSSYPINVIYCVPRYYVDSDVLSELYYAGYFDSFSDTVIFEIKTVWIEPAVLENIFRDLKSRDCKIIFVSAYNDPSSENFEKYVDCFMSCETRVSFSEFVETCVEKMLSKSETTDGGYVSFCILIDRRYVPIKDTDNVNIQTLYENSPYLRILLEQLCAQLSLPHNENDYTAVFKELNDRGIHLLVNIDGLMFYDLVTKTSCDVPDLYALESTFKLEPGKWNVFAMGMSDMAPDFYNLLKIMEKQALEFFDLYTGEFLTYLWRITPLVYDPNGLPVITDTDFNLEYHGIDEDALGYERDGVLGMILELLNLSV